MFGKIHRSTSQCREHSFDTFLRGNVRFTLMEIPKFLVSDPISERGISEHDEGGTILNPLGKPASAPTGIIVEFPAGSQPPDEGSSVARDNSRPLKSATCGAAPTSRSTSMSVKLPRAVNDSSSSLDG